MYVCSPLCNREKQARIKLDVYYAFCRACSVHKSMLGLRAVWLGVIQRAVSTGVR